MSGMKHNPDRLNTIGIVTVGLTGAALVYLAIVGIEAWYLNETSAVDQVAKFGKQAEVRKTLKSEQVGKITEPRLGTMGPNNTQLYTIGIDAAKDLIVRDAASPDHLVPAIGFSATPTIEPAFGRPRPLKSPAPPADGATPTDAVPGAPGTATPATPGAPGTEPAPPAGGATAVPGPAAGQPGSPGAGGGSAPAPTGGAATPAGTPAPAAAGSATPTPAAPPAAGAAHPAGGH